MSISGCQLQEREALGQFHSLKSKAFFILQLGYFRARRLFFIFDLRDAQEDAAYIREKYFPGFHDDGPEIAKRTRLKQQKLILALCRYRNADAAMQRKMEARAGQAAAVCGKPIYVFREVMHFVTEQRIVAPGYSTMQDMVGAGHWRMNIAALLPSYVIRLIRPRRRL